MKGLVAYSKPRGKFGVDYVFTIVIDFEDAPEADRGVYIDVSNPTTGRYSCHSCGHFGTVRVIHPTETKASGSLHFYRYDNVHAGDQIRIDLYDRGLVFNQSTYVVITQFSVSMVSEVNAEEEVKRQLPKVVYPMFLVNWDEHIEKQQQEGCAVRVEEELITNVMNNQQVTVKELLLQPPDQSRPLLEPSLHFLEGELRHGRK